MHSFIHAYICISLWSFIKFHEVLCIIKYDSTLIVGIDIRMYVYMYTYVKDFYGRRQKS